MPFPKCKTVQENPKTPTRTTKSTQVKLRLASPASSWMEGNFIAMAQEYFRVSFQQQSVSRNSLTTQERGEATEDGFTTETQRTRRGIEEVMADNKTLQPGWPFPFACLIRA